MIEISVRTNKAIAANGYRLACNLNKYVCTRIVTPKIVTSKNLQVELFFDDRKSNMCGMISRKTELIQHIR